MRRILLAVIALLTAAIAVAQAYVAATPAAAKTKDERVTGTLTNNGCSLTDSVSWKHLRPIYRIDTTLNRDEAPFIVAASIISNPQLGQPALTSAQTIETFLMTPELHTFSYSVTFVLKDRRGRVVATTTSPARSLACAFTT